jgi:hypothetical protein
LGQKVGADGKLWIMQPDNAEPLVSLTAPGRKHYYAGANQTKYKLNITANGNDLFVTNPEFCVGQKINFQAVFTPSLSPPITQYTWNYTADYINNHWTDANGCEEYNIAPIPTMSNPTPAWFYNKHTQDATANLGLYCKFDNGQSVYLVRQGKFNVFTPTVTMSDIRARHFRFDYGDLLGLGEADNTGAMVYQINYNTKTPFSGTGRITQLCQLNFSGVHYPSCSFPDFRRDGIEAYEQDVITPNTAKVSLTLQDGPYNVDAFPNTLKGSFQDYIRFCPDAGNAGDNIFVTLGIVTWRINATATSPLINLIIISPSETPDPTGPDNSNNFPIWANTH